MKTQRKSKVLTLLLAVFTGLFFQVDSLWAHCDTMKGPVVADAEKALAAEDVTTLLKGVSVDNEAVIREAFNHTLKVRALGEDAKQLADLYFFETLVRIHRAGEGAPYTGLKPGADIDPAVALADKAIKEGSVDKLVKVLTGALEKGLQEKFNQVMETGKQADKDVASGREFVEAYVQFTHFAEGIHGLIKGGSQR